MRTGLRSFATFITIATTLSGALLLLSLPALAADEKITICKAVTGAAFSGTPTFDFVDDEVPAAAPTTNSLTPSGCFDFEVAIATEYSIIETAMPAYWSLTDVTCDSGVWAYLPSTNEVRVTIALNDAITCTFTNTYGPPPPPPTGTIQIATRSIGDPYPGDPDFEFTGAFSELLGPDETSTKKTVLTGTHTVTEGALPDGWTLSDIECATDQSTDTTANTIDTPARTVGMNVSANEDVVCTFVHRYTALGSIVVDVITAPAAGPTVFDFDLSGTGFQLSDAAAPFDSGLMPIGTYNLSESVPAGWELTATSCDDGSIPAAIDLSDGETVTCTFANTKLATIAVAVKAPVEAAREGVASRAMFAAQSEGFSFTGDLVGELSPGDSMSREVLPGTYSVRERKSSGWELKKITCQGPGASGDVATRTATFVVEAGDSVTCTFRNTPAQTGVFGGSDDDSPDDGPSDDPEQETVVQARPPLTALPLTGAPLLDYATLAVYLILAGLFALTVTSPAATSRSARPSLAADRATEPPALSPTWTPVQRNLRL